MDCIVHAVTKSRTQLRDFHFHIQQKTVKVIHKEHTKPQFYHLYSWASLVAQLVKNPPAMPET